MFPCLKNIGTMLLVILLSTLSVACSQIIPENPCVDFFSYRQQNGIYYGEIDVSYDGSKSFDLAVNISMVGLYDNLKLTLELLTPSNQISSTPVLKYRVLFPLRNVIPRITQITFNDRILCSGPSEKVTGNGVTNLWAKLTYKINQYTYTVPNKPINEPVTPNTVNTFISERPTNPFFTAQRPTFTTSEIVPIQEPITAKPINTQDEICGIANAIQTLILGGNKTIENEYPWLVAMFHRKEVSYNFLCTANLVSMRHIITAAHCVWFYNAPLIDKEDILLVLGRSDISHWASGGVLRTADEVTPHPNYKQGSGHCDLAVIKMNKEVTYQPTIRPICLWQGDSKLKLITNSEGIVAGWGAIDKNHDVVATPQKVAMPVVSQETCLRSHSDFRNLTSEMTFCAGNKNGSGPCNGDSGAGFIMKKDRKWFLRGVVSTALKNSGFSCNLNEFIVFSDVAKLNDWIRLVMK